MISIVIPNYNGEKLLKKNLPKVFKSLNGSTEVIVVDDASLDRSVKFLKTQKVKLLKNSKNLGFSSTINKGVRAAMGDIVVLLNTDAYPQKDFLEPLLAHFSDPVVFAVGALDKSIENGKIVLRGRGIGNWEKGFLVHKRGEVNKANTLWVSGGSGAFRKSIWEKLSGFDELYNPFYWEDIDLSYRALKSGYKIVFEPKSIVFHEHHRGAIATNYSNFQIRVVSYRNQFIFSWKNATDFLLQVSEILFLPYHFIVAAKSKNWPFFIAFIKAFVLLPKIIQSSLRAQKLFLKSDRDVTHEFKE